MKDLWHSFLYGFCKVDFLCWQGDPNWLGWAAIGVGTWIALVIVIVVLQH